MLSYVLRRLLSTLPVVLMVAVVVFAILRLSPGDPAAVIAGDNATTEQLDQIRVNMGLDKPMALQFVLWVSQLARGDLGVSLISGVPVTQMIEGRIGPTLALAATTLVFVLLTAIPIGVLAAWRRGRWLDRATMSLSVLGFSVPVFVTGYALILLFAVKLGWLPVQGYTPLAKGLWPFLQHLVLPTLALSTVYIALIARITRSSIVEVMGEDFIRTARSKGLSERAVMLRHALSNAAVPVITVVGISVGLLLSGVVITESVFNLPGLGRLVLEAVLARDYPVIQGMILLFACVYIVINLVVDLLYTVADPRIRY